MVQNIILSDNQTCIFKYATDVEVRNTRYEQ